jgi:hypothetical protein
MTFTADLDDPPAITFEDLQAQWSCCYLITRNHNHLAGGDVYTAERRDNLSRVHRASLAELQREIVTDYKVVPYSPLMAELAAAARGKAQ